MRTPPSRSSRTPRSSQRRRARPAAALRDAVQESVISSIVAPTDLTPALQGLAQRADRILAGLLPDATQPPEDLHQAMRYAVLGGGKRMRPLLVYAAGEAFSAPLTRLDGAAAAVEIIHAYSLVHDDLPAMDDDALRRGRPTCHILFGEAMAVLAGDALQALAFDVLANHQAMDTKGQDLDATTRLQMLRVLSHACGSHGMAGGQAFDLSAVGRALSAHELERMHVHKTGALIRASVRLGALAAGCADADVLDALERYAHCIGLAFQIRDDILDVEGATAQLGKTAGKDAANDKPTYPAILGLQRSREQLVELTDEALDAIRVLGRDAHALQDLARFVAERAN